MWVRESTENYTTKNIKFLNCSFNQIQSKDEIIAIWDWNGNVENVLLDNCILDSVNLATCPHFVRLDGSKNIIIMNTIFNITSINAATSSVIKTEKDKIPYIYNSKIITSNRCANGVFLGNFKVYNTECICTSDLQEEEKKSFYIHSGDIIKFFNCYFEGNGINIDNVIIYDSIIDCRNGPLRLDTLQVEVYNTKIQNIKLLDDGIINQIVSDNLNSFIIDNCSFYLSNDNTVTPRYFLFHTGEHIDYLMIKDSYLLGGLYQLTVNKGIICNNITSVDYSDYSFDNIILNNNLHIV